MMDLAEDPYLTNRGSYPLDIFNDDSSSSHSLNSDRDDNEMSVVESEVEMSFQSEKLLNKTVL